MGACEKTDFLDEEKLDEIEHETEANRRAVNDELNAQHVNSEDTIDPVATTQKAVVWKAINKSRRHLTRPDAEARTIGNVPIPNHHLLRQTGNSRNRRRITRISKLILATWTASLGTSSNLRSPGAKSQR